MKKTDTSQPYRTKKKGFLSIGKKLFLAMLLLTLLPTTALTIYSTVSVSQSKKSEAIQNAEASVSWLRNKLNDLVVAYTRNFYDLETDTTFHDALLSWNDDPTSLAYDKREAIIGKLNGYLSANADLSHITLVGTKNGHSVDVTPTGASFTESKEGEAASYERESGLQTNAYFLWQQNEASINHGMNLSNGTLFAYASFHWRKDFFPRVIGEIQLSGLYGTMLLNDGNQTVCSVRDDSMGEFEAEANALVAQGNELSFTNGREGKHSFWFASSVSGGKLQILMAASKAPIRQAQSREIMMGIFVALTSVIVSAVLSAFLASRLSKPIGTLASTMRGSDFTKRPKVKETNHDEIGVLQRSFNQMSDDIADLIDSEYKSKLAARDAEFRAMQSQINPHFVYNTLQLIGGMSLETGDHRIYDLTTTFSDILHYSLSFDQEVVPLKEEIRYLEKYISIQNQRFSGRISFENQVNSEDMDTLVPKLILQPILENSFSHGLSEKSGPWKICLAAKGEGDDLSLTLSDNGVGMSQETLQSLRESLTNDPERSLRASKHIGLANVNLRARLLYGPSYGIHIESTPNEGTSVTVKVKKHWEEHR